MWLRPPNQTPVPSDAPRPLGKRGWRPGDVVTLVIVVCYGAAALIVAAGLFLTR